VRSGERSHDRVPDWSVHCGSVVDHSDLDADPCRLADLSCHRGYVRDKGLVVDAGDRAGIDAHRGGRGDHVDLVGVAT
jgi:hypothetical protein